MTTTNPDRDNGDGTDSHGLREEVEALRERVAELERLLEQDDESPSRGDVGTLDRRDRAVLADVRDRDGDPGPRGTVGLYTQLTDITNRDTAVTRAKRLRRMDAWQEAVGE